MQGICPNEGCGAVYTLGPEHVGRQFQCRKCGALLTVETNGLALARGPGAIAMTPATAPEFPSAVPVPTRSPAAGNSIFDRLPPEFMTYLFIVGAILVVLFLFLPLLDHGSAMRQSALARMGDLEQERLDRQLRADDHTPTAEETKNRDDAKKDWAKKKVDIQADASADAASADAWQYWYDWGTMIGFLLLTVASIGYLRDGAKIKRVVGSIIICAILLVVFFTYLRSPSSLPIPMNN